MKISRVVFFNFIMIPISIQTFAWDGFQWETWREISQAQPLDIQTAQRGHSQLLPLMQMDWDPASRIETIEQWETKRDAILATLTQILGHPSNRRPLPPYVEWLGEEDAGSYWRMHIRVSTERDDWIPAYLLIPKPFPTTPQPTMIVLHQTVSQGKEEPCAIRGDPELAFAHELAQRGYVCIVPDVIGFGERTPPGQPPYSGAHDFFRKHPQWSFFGKMVWDIQRLVDFLETLPFVDPYRIGSIGHSHGAYGTIMATVFEPRISAAIASCGFTTLRSDPVPERWSHLTALMPQMGFWVKNIEDAPFDWHEIIACIAPRPYLNWATLDDSIFPETGNFPEIYQQLNQVYALYGAQDNLSTHIEPGKHSFPRKQREMAYQWLDHQLPARLDLAKSKQTPPVSKEEWENLRPRIRALIQRDLGPVDPPALENTFEVLEEKNTAGFTESKIRYRVNVDEPVSAYLLKPNSSRTKQPAMIVFHQTTEWGKEEPVGHQGRPSLHFAPELALRGYVVLAPDSITAGERIDPPGAFETRDFYRRYPNLSAMGKMIQDGRRAIDILQSLPYVDPGRIGVMGHSLGAEEALFVAAFDTRIKASVASCGFAPLRLEKNPQRWARDHWFSYIPRWRIDLRAGRKPSWDFDDVIRLVAPRGYFNFQTEDDTIFPDGVASHVMTLASRSVWRLYNANDQLRSRLDPGPHDITPEAKDEVYRWLDSILHP